MAGFTFVPTGPFSNGGAPGFSAAFGNDIEEFIQQLQGDINSVAVSGQTSGTATLYQVVQGTIKRTIIHLVNYKNTANQFITLPTAYTDRALVSTGDVGGNAIAFFTGGSGGSAVNVKVLSAISASSGGTQATQIYIKYFSYGQIDAAWDTLELQVNTGAANGVIVIEGF
jgi:hypothetical protein